MTQFYVTVTDDSGRLWEFIPVTNNIRNINKGAAAALHEASDRIRRGDEEAGKLN